MTPLNQLPPHVADVLRDAIEVTLPSPDNFLKIKETLTRMGIASQREKLLVQSCHILHKRGHYYVIHYKEAFLLDGKAAQTNFTDNDRARRNTIASLLSEWGLVVVVNAVKLQPCVPKSEIDVLPFRDKPQWTLVAKYEVGKKGARTASTDTNQF